MKLGFVLNRLDPCDKVQIRARCKGGKNTTCIKNGYLSVIHPSITLDMLDWNVYKIREIKSWGYQLFCEV